MNKLVVLNTIALMLLGSITKAQVGVGTTTPHESAIMEVKSENKGFLPPRMTILERNAINTPSDGLFIYCNNCCVNGALSVFAQGKWDNMPDCTDTDLDDDGIPNEIDIDDDNDGIIDNLESGILNQPSFESPTGPAFTENNLDNFNGQYGTTFWQFLDHGNVQPWGGILKNGNTPHPGHTNQLDAYHGEYYLGFHSGDAPLGEGVYNNLLNPLINGGKYKVGFHAYQMTYPPYLNNPGSMKIYGIKTGVTIPSFIGQSINPTNVEAHPSVFDLLGTTEEISNTTAWEAFSIEFTCTDNYDRVLFVIDGINCLLGFDNFIIHRDTDNDGLFDFQDSDSDNDGCSDARENGLTLSNDPNFTFNNSSVGSNGLLDNLETSPDNGTVITPLHPTSDPLNAADKVCP